MHGYDQFIVQVDLTRVMSKLLFLKYLDTTTGFSLSYLFSYSNFMICICSLNSLKIIYKLWRYKPDKMTTSISQTWWYAGLIIPEFLHRDPSPICDLPTGESEVTVVDSSENQCPCFLENSVSRQTETQNYNFKV